MLGTIVSATVFTLQNRCSYTVWPGTLSGNGAASLGDGGFELAPGATMQLPAPLGWSGRFWGRTWCNFDSAGNGNCSTGDCGGLQCTGGGAPPVTLVEFTLNGVDNKDFYDVSLVDGYNVGMGVRPTGGGGTGDCQYAGCVSDVNGLCPRELQVTGSAGGVIACKSACTAFNTPEYCCTGEHSTPATCSPTQYSMMFKNACPTAYSYAYDDATSTCTCTGSDYLIQFCPPGS
ncbi:pathogenesis-related protein 5-like isoform X2 [Diospyros lotus]|uniref:pathogenesis-related protein 5-like isoform X2 n=1 Tax=Diospyros lotus TaxID=55363 RepID=UPI00225A1B74|nr:pathogenesis-related protein 5-like isoform X2 [Diospyros lotus]